MLAAAPALRQVIGPQTDVVTGLAMPTRGEQEVSAWQHAGTAGFDVFSDC